MLYLEKNHTTDQLLKLINDKKYFINFVDFNNFSSLIDFFRRTFVEVHTKKN